MRSFMKSGPYSDCYSTAFVPSSNNFYRSRYSEELLIFIPFASSLKYALISFLIRIVSEMSHFFHSSFSLSRSSLKTEQSRTFTPRSSSFPSLPLPNNLSIRLLISSSINLHWSFRYRSWLPKMPKYRPGYSMKNCFILFTWERSSLVLS